jgi:hypothetical protein
MNLQVPKRWKFNEQLNSYLLHEEDNTPESANTKGNNVLLMDGAVQDENINCFQTKC